MDDVGVEEGDRETGETEELCKFEHTTNMALDRKGEYEYMWRT